MAYNYISEIADKLGATEGYSDIERIKNAIGEDGGGSGGGVFFIDYTETQGIPQVTTLLKTWNEIMAAVSAGMLPMLKHEYEDSVTFSPVSYMSGGDSYMITIGDYPNTKTLSCTDPDDYPTRTYYPE